MLTAQIVANIFRANFFSNGFRSGGMRYLRGEIKPIPPCHFYLFAFSLN